MRFVRLAPLIVLSLLVAGTTAAWLASRSAGPGEGFAAATSVALWLLGFALLAFVVAALAAGVAVVRRKELTVGERLAGMLPFPVLIAALVAALIALR